MEPIEIGLWVSGGMLVFVLLGMRVAFAAGLAGFVGLFWLRWNGFDYDPERFWKALEISVKIAGLTPHSKVSAQVLSLIPVFILIGYLAYHAQLTTALFTAAKRWIAWVPGGLAVSTVFATAGFAAVSGASTATSAVFSRVAIPEMLKYGYNRRLAAGVVAAGGTLATLIPPSAIIVIYAIIVEESVGKLLLAGFLPGLVSAAIYAGIIIVWAMARPDDAPSVGGFTWGERVKSLPGVLPIFVVVFIIISAIYGGWATPTEAGALGAAVVFGLAVMRGTKLKDIQSSLMEAAKLTVMIFSLIWGVLIFVRFLGFSGLPEAFTVWIVGLDVPPMVIMICILLAYAVLGMFMDAIGMLLLTLPVVYPAVIALGFDSIWFGIIVVKMAEVCLITPPIGLNCFVVNGVRPDIPLTDVFRGIALFFIADVLTIAALLAFPEIVTWLPNFVG